MKASLFLLLILLIAAPSTQATTYTAWAAIHGNILPTDDADQDGLANGIEYAMGTDPQQVNAMPFFCSQQGADIIVKWTQTKQMTDLTIAPESTDDLGTTWSDLTVAPADRSVSSMNSELEEVSMILRNTGDQHFIRLQFNFSDITLSGSSFFWIKAGNGEVSLIWNEVSGASDYSIYYNTAGAVSTGDPSVVRTGNSTTLTGLTNGQTYYVAIQPNNGSGSMGVLSAELSATPQAIAASLGAPQQVSAIGGNKQATVSWDAVSGASNYTLYWSTSANVDENSARIDSVTSPYTHQGLDPNTDYYYLVQAMNATGVGPVSHVATAVTEEAVMGIPQNLTAVATDGQITLNWDPAPNATSYTIHQGISSGVDARYPVAGTVQAPSTTFVHSGLINGDWYAYILTATGPNGTSAISEYVQIKPTATPLPPVPSEVSLTKISLDQAIHLSWSPDDQADSYTIYWSTNFTTTTTISGLFFPTTNTTVSSIISSNAITNLTGPDYTHSNLINGINYAYSIAAVNTHGIGPMYDYTMIIPGGEKTPILPNGAAWSITATPGNQQATISWPVVPNTTSYDLHRAPYASCYSSADYTVIPNVSSPYTDQNLSNGTEYYYSVVPKNAEGSLHAASAATRNVLVVPRSVIAAPTHTVSNLSASGADRQTVLQWTEDSLSGSYAIYWNTNATINIATAQKVTVLHQPWTHTGLENDQPYYYAVTAINQVGEGPLSSVISATPSSPSVAPSIPQNLTVDYIGYRRASLKWDPVPGASAYIIYWSVGSTLTTDSALITDVITPSYIHKGLSAKQNYTYAVAAINELGISSKSTPTTFMLTHKDAANQFSGHADISYSQYQPTWGSSESDRMWISNHLWDTGDFKGIFVCDKHGALKGLDRNPMYRLFAERNDFLLLRLGIDDPQVPNALQSEESALIWLQEMRGYKRDLTALPRITAGLSSSAGGAVTMIESYGEQAVATVAYAQPVSSGNASIPLLCATGSEDRYSGAIYDFYIPLDRQGHGNLFSSTYNKGYPHNSLGDIYHVTSWLNEIIDMRLRPDGSVAPVNTDQSVTIKHDASFNTEGYLLSMSNVVVKAFEQHSDDIWWPTEEGAENWQYHVAYPHAIWLETPRADFIPVNTDTTISARLGDPNEADDDHLSRVNWSQISGPGTATFNTIEMGITTYLTLPKSSAGSYTVRLSITADGTTTDHDTTFSVSGTYQSTRTDQTIRNIQSLEAISWTQISGPGSAGFTDLSVSFDQTVRFDQVGSYVIRLTMEDTDGHVREKDMTFHVN